MFTYSVGHRNNNNDTFNQTKLPSDNRHFNSYLSNQSLSGRRNEILPSNNNNNNNYFREFNQTNQDNNSNSNYYNVSQRQQHNFDRRTNDTFTNQAFNSDNNDFTRRVVNKGNDLSKSKWNNTFDRNGSNSLKLGNTNNNSTKNGYRSDGFNDEFCVHMRGLPHDCNEIDVWNVNRTYCQNNISHRHVSFINRHFAFFSSSFSHHCNQAFAKSFRITVASLVVKQKFISIHLKKHEMQCAKMVNGLEIVILTYSLLVPMELSIAIFKFEISSLSANFS